jgi:small conductance mechanosensitive channel
LSTQTETTNTINTLFRFINRKKILDLVDRAGGWLADHALFILLILIGSIILYRLVSVAINHTVELISRDTFLPAEQAKQRAKTLGAVLDALTRFVIFFFAGLIILQNTGVKITALIAGASVVGVAIGFGAQSLVRDFISGFFILFENQYGVGDTVQVGTSKGTVENLSLRTTQIRDFEGRLHTIPNGEIKLVINQSRGWTQMVVDIGTSYREDPVRVMQIMADETTRIAQSSEWRENIIQSPQVLGVEAFTDSAMVFRVTALTKPGLEDSLARQVRAAIKTRFSAEDIAFSDK